MNKLIAIFLSLSFVAFCHAQGASEEQRVRATVEAFYRAFNAHDFDAAASFTTDDWQHINPGGGWTKGRSQVLQELVAVHSTFLKGVTDTVESMSVSFATPDVAVATVISNMTAFTMPNGVLHPNDRQIRTFVIVRRSAKWLVMLDQNTIVKR